MKHGFLLAVAISLPFVGGDLTRPQLRQVERLPEHEVIETSVMVGFDGCKCVGSGVVVSTNGETYVLTAAHVAVHLVDKDAIVSQTCGLNSRTWHVDVAVFSKQDDLALLRVRNPADLVAAKYDPAAKPTRGETLWYCGNPRGFPASLEKSIVNHARVKWQGHWYLSTNGNGWYGNSGCGAFVVRDGRPVLVGILVRLAWGDPRSPVLCENQDAIDRIFGEAVKAALDGNEKIDRVTDGDGMVSLSRFEKALGDHKK